MKRTRRFLYLFVMAIVVAAIAVFAFACGDGDNNATEYTLTFMNGTAVHDTIKGTAGSAVEFNKDEPTRTNLVFDGWSETDGGEVVELPTKMPAENKTYYAVFSARYTITLNTGTAVELNPISAKAGTSLYELVSGIAPAANGDATFEAWYYGNNKVDADSTAVMPETNITLNAKYTVDYVVNVYKQNGISDEDGEATYGTATQISGSGYVGDWVSLTPDEGYEQDLDKGDIFSSTLAFDKSQNTYEVYYNFREYTIMFNPNLPAEVVSGDMDNDSVFYSQEYEVPKCGYAADGYHFVGWSTTASGGVEYYAGDDFEATRTTTFYAVWAKSLVDSNGQSYDYVYICDNADGSETVSYFKRYGFVEMEGTYNESTGIFAIKNSAGDTLVRGYADVDAGTYTYLAIGENNYVLSNMFGDVDNDVTLELDDASDTAYYTVSGNKTTGKYSYDVDSGALKFTSEDITFEFRLKTFQSKDGDVQAFVIRGEEMGEWDRLEQDGTMKGNYYLSLDGFGGAKLYCRDTVSSSTATWTAIGGIYEVVEESSVDGIEILVIIYGTRTRAFYCLLLEGEETNIYLEKTLAYTFTDKSGNGDTLTLDGYGVYADSAEYTKGGVTSKYGYVYDDYMGAVALIDANGELAYMFELSSKADPDNAEQYIYNFELAEDLFGVYVIVGLNNTAFANGFVMFEIYNNGYADFAILLPLTSNYYGNSYMDYYVVLSGTYEYLEDTDEYTFKGDVNANLAYSVYSLYAQAGITLNISNWGDIKFAPIYDDETNEIVLFTLIAYGDGMGGRTLTYDGVKYMLDGYGNAVDVADGDNVKSYALLVDMGAPRVSLTWTETVEEQEVEYSEVFVYIDGEFRQYLGLYSGYNARSSIGIMLLEGDYAVLFYYSSNSIVMFSWGKVTWSENDVVIVEGEGEDEETYTYKYATYVESAGMNSMFVPLEKEYDNFQFCLDDGTWFVVYKGDVNSNGVSTITYNGATLTIDTINITATYTAADGKIYDGSLFTYYDDIIVIYYKITEEDGSTSRATISIKINSNSFEVLNLVAGKWISDVDSASYLELDGKGGATYNVYNSDGSYTKIAGTYAKSAAARQTDEYTFTSSSGTFDFIVGYSSDIPLFVKYETAVGDGESTYQIVNSTGSSVVGLVKGGGYDYVMLQYGSSVMYYGGIEFVENDGYYDIYKFTAVYYRPISGQYLGNAVSSGVVAYLMFVQTQSGNEFFYMLDSFYNDETNGVFTLNTPYAVSDDAIVSLHFVGYLNIVELVFSNSDNNMTVYYMSYDENTYMAYYVDSYNQKRGLFLFRLYSDYSADIADESNNMFGNVDNFTLVDMDGFGNAVYIDANGVYHSATYEWYDRDNGVIRLTYVDEYYNVYTLYIKLDYDYGLFESYTPNSENMD